VTAVRTVSEEKKEITQHERDANAEPELGLDPIETNSPVVVLTEEEEGFGVFRTRMIRVVLRQ
jgi:hypothetical protein